MGKNNKMGLTTKEAEKRLVEYGYNELSSKKKISACKIFVSQFKDILIIILLVSTILSVLMGEIVEAIAIIAIVFINSLLGFFQEYKTEKTLDALKKMAAPLSKVMRDGKVLEISARELVIGDMILIEAGDKIPADAEVLESRSLMVDESILTGESVSVEKSENSSDNIIFMGTIATKGRCSAVITKTGMNTEMGKIAHMLNDIEDEQTPLQKRLDQLGKYIAVGCLGICLIVTLAGIMRGEKVFDMVVTGISLAVAAVPEGLPTIVTISLALAVSRMLKRNALVRKLDAVETLGCASVICSDKTGTLTENKMTVTKISTYKTDYEVTGSGYSKSGDILQNDAKITIERSPDIQKLLEIAVLCNNAEISENGGFNKSQFKVTGEATEIALMILGAKAGVTLKSISTKYYKYDEIPFDSDRKCMSVIAKDKCGNSFSFTKGAVDVILDKCSFIQVNDKVVPIEHSARISILKKAENMGENALRVLGFAYKQLADSSKANAEDNLIFVGLTGMIDMPRKEAFDAVLKCKKAGIKTVMITGDHKTTATAIAKSLGIYKNGDLVLTGKELDMMSDAEFERKVRDVSVYARVNPSHKLKIVKALKKRGNIVAMTGDGVNDSPAIKEADIGAAMGINGTDVTKEAASIVLLDDNFATLVAAIAEGRVIYKNIRKFIRYLISCNIGEVMTMFLGMIMGMPVVLLPIQILLVNLVTDGLPAIALGLDPADDDAMAQKPRGKNESVFSNGLLSTIIFRGMIIGISTLGAFVTLTKYFGSLDVARTGALLTLILSQLIHVFECKSETKPIYKINLLNNNKLILAVLFSFTVAICAVYVPQMQMVFSTVALKAPQLVISILYSLIGVVLSGFKRMRKPKSKLYNTN